MTHILRLMILSLFLTTSLSHAMISVDDQEVSDSDDSSDDASFQDFPDSSEPNSSDPKTKSSSKSSKKAKAKKKAEKKKKSKEKKKAKAVKKALAKVNAQPVAAPSVINNSPINQDDAIPQSHNDQGAALDSAQPTAEPMAKPETDPSPAVSTQQHLADQAETQRRQRRQELAKVNADIAALEAQLEAKRQARLNRQNASSATSSTSSNPSEVTGSLSDSTLGSIIEVKSKRTHKPFTPKSGFGYDDNDLLTIAMTAKLAYADPADIEKQGQFKVINHAKLDGIDQTGHVAVALYEPKQKILYVSYRGSSDQNIYKDFLISDGQIVLNNLMNVHSTKSAGNLFKRFNESIDFYHQSEELADNMGLDISDIRVTGHSLGGFLAQAVGMKTGIPTFSFNGPGIPNSYHNEVAPNVFNFIKCGKAGFDIVGMWGSWDHKVNQIFFPVHDTRDIFTFNTHFMDTFIKSIKEDKPYRDARLVYQPSLTDSLVKRANTKVMVPLWATNEAQKPVFDEVAKLVNMVTGHLDAFILRHGSGADALRIQEYSQMVTALRELYYTETNNMKDKKITDIDLKRFRETFLGLSGQISDVILEARRFKDSMQVKQTSSSSTQLS